MDNGICGGAGIKMGDKEIFVENCLKFLDEHKSEYNDEVLIRSAIVKTKSGEWVNGLTTFIIPSNNQSFTKMPNIVYDKLILLQEVVNLEKFRDIIKNLWGGLKISEYKINFSGNYHRSEYLYNHNIFSNWPGLYFEISYMYNSDAEEIFNLNYPLVKYDYQCFMSAYDAMKGWFEIQDFDETRDSRLGKILIFLPNYRARIKDIKFDGKILDIYIDTNQTLDPKLQCQIIVNYITWKLREILTLKNEESKFSLKLDEEPLNTYIQLVTPAGEKVDYYYENQFYHTGTIRFIRRGINKDLIKKISSGENEQIEFKTFFSIGDRNKENDIIETVISFANTNNGSMIFGVSDHSELEGISSTLLKNLSDEQFIEKFQKHMRKIVSDKIDKGVSLKFSSFKIGDKTILDMEVFEGSDKPYFNIETNQTYIRRGSTDRRPNGEEIKLLFNNKKTI